MNREVLPPSRGRLPRACSNFLTVKVSEEAVWLVDQCSPRNPSMSVTNDAENVVAHCIHHHGSKRIFYRDTEGRWDELVHDGSTFVRYAPAAEHAIKV